MPRCRRDELIERFELDPSKKGRAYSKVDRQEVALVAARSSGVELPVLDEPTAGLDPLMEQVFQDCVRELSAWSCSPGSPPFWSSSPSSVSVAVMS